MTPSQPSTPPAHPAGRPEPVVQALRQDEDVALGFECAHPALQFERWGHDEPAAGLARS